VSHYSLVTTWWRTRRLQAWVTIAPSTSRRMLKRELRLPLPSRPLFSPFLPFSFFRARGCLPHQVRELAQRLGVSLFLVKSSLPLTVVISSPSSLEFPPSHFSSSLFTIPWMRIQSGARTGEGASSFPIGVPTACVFRSPFFLSAFFFSASEASSSVEDMVELRQGPPSTRL